MDLTHKKAIGGNNSMKAVRYRYYIIVDNKKPPVRIFEKVKVEDNFFFQEDPFRSIILL